jgi:hypothetical protein
VPVSPDSEEEQSNGDVERWNPLRARRKVSCTAIQPTRSTPVPTVTSAVSGSPRQAATDATLRGTAMTSVSAIPARIGLANGARQVNSSPRSMTPVASATPPPHAAPALTARNVASNACRARVGTDAST